MPLITLHHHHHVTHISHTTQRTYSSPSDRDTYYNDDQSPRYEASPFQHDVDTPTRGGARRHSKSTSTSSKSSSNSSSSSRRSKYEDVDPDALECARARDLELWTRWRCQMNDALISDFISGDKSANGTITPIEVSIPLRNIRRVSRD